MWFCFDSFLICFDAPILYWEKQQTIPIHFCATQLQRGPVYPHPFFNLKALLLCTVTSIGDIH